jgi:putative heme-binding domain-containing protein
MKHAIAGTWSRFWLTVTAVMLAGGALHVPARAQNAAAPGPGGGDVPADNPLHGNADAIRAGMGMYRVRCADCHGMDARGIRGPDLSQVWASGRSDGGLFRTLRSGVPGTEMPPVGDRTSNDDIWKILAYLRTLAAPAPGDPARGDAASGERVFRATCSGCHRVNGRGGRLGPDLSRIGISRARAALVRRIRGAVEDHRPGYEPVTLTTASGQEIHAVKKNEDLFSVQVMDTRERIQGYLKEDLREVKDEKASAMPVYDVAKLSERDLDDLLAYLATLKSADTAVK